MQHKVFIHTNHKQWLGALVSQYSMTRNSRHADRFAVEIIRHTDYPFFQEFEGKSYLRDGVTWTWLNDDLQSFTPLRFMPPELMGYSGRAVVVDPDVFAVGDVFELLTRDMQDKALVCRPRSGLKKVEGCFATSVMLLDCAKLTHWRVEEQFRQLFEMKRDYREWICLKYEDGNQIGQFEYEWNDFDKLTPKTKLIHNTKRKTQPWKAGLPVDFRPAEQFRLFPPIGWLMQARRRLLGDYALLGRYKTHPDRRQEQFFFGLLKECLEKGVIAEDTVRAEMAQNHVRHDAFEVVDRTPPLEQLYAQLAA